MSVHRLIQNLFLYEEDDVRKFWRAKGRGGKKAREEKIAGSMQQSGASNKHQTVGLGKENYQGKKEYDL